MTEGTEKASSHGTWLGLAALKAAPGFRAAQLAGAFAATILFRRLVPPLPKQAHDVVAHGR